MALYRCGSSGGTQFKCGTVTFTSASSSITVTTGFRPKYIAVFTHGKSGSASSTANGSGMLIYDADYSTSYYTNLYKNGNGTLTLNAPSVDGLSITDTSFNISIGSISAQVTTWYYFAVG